jgi:hypothetical protein
VGALGRIRTYAHGCGGCAVIAAPALVRPSRGPPGPLVFPHPSQSVLDRPAGTKEARRVLPDVSVSFPYHVFHGGFARAGVPVVEKADSPTLPSQAHENHSSPPTRTSSRPARAVGPAATVTDSTGGASMTAVIVLAGAAVQVEALRARPRPLPHRPQGDEDEHPREAVAFETPLGPMSLAVAPPRIPRAAQKKHAPPRGQGASATSRRSTVQPPTNSPAPGCGGGGRGSMAISVSEGRPVESQDGIGHSGPSAPLNPASPRSGPVETSGERTSPRAVVINRVPELALPLKRPLE